MRRHAAPFRATLALIASLTATTANAQVFINEVFTNPPGDLDQQKEFIELMGTPGMKLDGYAIAMANGTQEKYYPLGSVPPAPVPAPEFDEFFSLDGLALGANGILVIGGGDISSYDLLLPDTNYQRWDMIWNGGIDVPGKLENDGSTTVFLLRNRPGATQADPNNPIGLRWGKDVPHDTDVTVPVIDPQDGSLKAHWGDGALDEGGVNQAGQPKLDFTGTSTPFNPSDDLEIVDEVSWEHDRGWEYDVDARKVDVGSAFAGLPERGVHALDDPQGLNPDAISRVDSRLVGAGHAPVNGATGQLPNGNNWQDTATEQWIRGESAIGSGGIGAAPQLFYDNSANTNADAIQPFLTQVPLWLNDGLGADYAFAQDSYQIMPGRVNPLAIPFIPGDATRDGLVGQADVDKIASVFGDANWIFANGSASAAMGNAGNPAEQIRPWDVDTNGEYGVDPNDLQWALTFQGDTTGRIAGVTYDSPVPSINGVKLNPGVNVSVTLSSTQVTNCGRPLAALHLNDIVEVTVRGRVTGGALTTPGHENGIQQFLHDLILSAPGVLEVVNVEAVGAFRDTRATLLAPLGPGFEFGATNINGHSLSFSQGLLADADLYRVRLRAVNPGTTGVFIQAAQKFEFQATTPRGIKVAHTDNHGNPSVTVYPNAFAVTVLNVVGPALDAYGAGCAGTAGFVPTLTGEGCSNPGGAFTLRIDNGQPGATPLLFLGFGQATLPLNFFCALQNGPVFPGTIVLPPLFGVAPGDGNLLLPGLSIPVSAPAPLSIYIQALFADAGASGGASSTNPLHILVGQ